ncbi:hypothetical protein GCM10007148_09410 [Parvularcula lutaonensis]|nr:hypothetical protein GCM10007148_09410 [Parvularcula lutaonensis]
MSIVFLGDRGGKRYLDGSEVPTINADLSARTSGVDFSRAARLGENAKASFQGTIKVGDFDIERELAVRLINAPTNPNGERNERVVRPWANGQDVTGRSSEKWIIDFGTDASEADAAMFEAPFEHLLHKVKPARAKVRRRNHRERWWIFGEARPAMRRALTGRARYLATPRVAKWRLFKWLDVSVVPDGRLVVIARDDDTSFVLLQGRIHEVWSLATGGWHGKGNDPQYTPTNSFETFPFPEGLTPDIPAEDYADDPRAIRIAEAAERLNTLRENWLNPEDLVIREPEVVEGYPDRILPRDEEAAKILKKRTLTNLYNERPAWLDHAHAELDRAVAAAYGWEDDWEAGMDEEDILKRLFDLNQQRAANQ